MTDLTDNIIIISGKAFSNIIGFLYIFNLEQNKDGNYEIEKSKISKIINDITERLEWIDLSYTSQHDKNDYNFNNLRNAIISNIKEFLNCLKDAEINYH